MKKNKDGAKDFDQYFLSMYKDEYQTLKEEMLKENKNIYTFTNGKNNYYLDSASKLVSTLLPIENNYKILDMCSAPGGKALGLISRFKENNSLVCNEINTNRRLRLLKVINTMVPQELRDSILIKGYDASTWSLYEKDAYDSILCDVPCSSERHLLNCEKELQKWSTSKVKRTCALQYSILCSALDAVKVGGYILYSTCSINENENEKIIEKLNKKRKNRFKEISLNVENSRKCSFGYILLPHLCNGSGPLYFSLLQRIE